MPLARDETAKPGERRAAADYLVEASDLSGSASARHEALDLLLATGTLDPSEAAQVHRNLAEAARRGGERDAARAHLAASLERAPDQPQTLADLAVLERAAGLARASAMMSRAIAAMEASGEAVPDNWRSFVEPN